MALTVRPARSGADRKAFLDVAERLHEGDPIWTPPLRQDLQRALSDENPLWRGGRGERELLLAYEGDRVVGRVLAHVHSASNERHHEQVGLFGLLEFPEGDERVAHALLDAVAEKHRARGLSLLRGPYELTITQSIGALTAGFDDPASFSQGWTGPHVAPALERYGFKPSYLATTHRLDDISVVNPDVLIGEKQRAWLADPKVRLRAWDMAHFDRDVRAATSLLNESFADNYGFVPLSDDEVTFMAGPMKRVVRPELTVFLEYDGEPVGVGMALPDFHVLFRRMRGRLFPFGWATFLAGSRTLDAAVVQFLATTPKLQNQGLMRIVVSEIIRRLQHAHFRSLDGTWIGDVNPKSLAQAHALGMRDKHRLAVFEKSL
jgi:GNAT superfamily N-acetyltransferase